MVCKANFRPSICIIRNSQSILYSKTNSRLALVKPWLNGRVANFSMPGTDLFGTTALMHAISTKPFFDPEFAQLMFDAGGDINRRDRVGGVAAHDITTVHLVYQHAPFEKAAQALQWYLEHGGILDVEDGDGMDVRRIITTLAGNSSDVVTEKRLKAVVDRYEKQKAEGTVPDRAITGPTPRNGPCPCGSSHKFKKCCGKE